MNAVVAIVILLILLVAALAGYEYYKGRSPALPAVSPATITWELS